MAAIGDALYFAWLCQGTEMGITTSTLERLREFHERILQMTDDDIMAMSGEDFLLMDDWEAFWKRFWKIAKIPAVQERMQTETFRNHRQPESSVDRGR